MNLATCDRLSTIGNNPFACPNSASPICRKRADRATLPGFQGDEAHQRSGEIIPIVPVNPLVTAQEQRNSTNRTTDIRT